MVKIQHSAQEQAAGAQVGTFQGTWNKFRAVLRKNQQQWLRYISRNMEQIQQSSQEKPTAVAQVHYFMEHGTNSAQKAQEQSEVA